MASPVSAKLAELLGELHHRGAITITTPDQRELEEKSPIDFVTVIHLDGVVITHVSAELLGDGARLQRSFEEHQGRVAVALAKVTDVQRLADRFQSMFSAALIAVPLLAGLLNVWEAYRQHGNMAQWKNIVLIGVGVVGVPLQRWIKSYAQRVWGWIFRKWAGRAIPAVASKLLGAGRG